MFSRKFIFIPAVLSVILLWTAAILSGDRLPEIAANWRITLTMVFGSFIAGATSEGGGAVAFPVFTKVLGIPSSDARLFALMIQSMGMTMAGLFIWTRRIPVLWNLVGPALGAGIVGFVAGSLWLQVPDPFPKLVFTFVTGVFGLFLAWNRWGADHVRVQQLELYRRGVPAHLILVGLLGGAVSSMVGVGIDMVLFILLTLRYGVDEKMSTPTTVVLMGLLSLFGFGWHAAAGNIPEHVWGYWLSAVPVVVIGAPFGAWVCSRLHRDQLIVFLLMLIVLEVVSTFILIPISYEAAVVLGTLFVTTVALFIWMIRLRDAPRNG